MKNLIARILVIGTALAGVVSVHAADKAITAYVPFNFYAGPQVYKCVYISLCEQLE